MKSVARPESIDTPEDFRLFLEDNTGYFQSGVDISPLSQIDNPLSIKLQDAWRSTRITTNQDDALVNLEFDQLPLIPRITSMVTSIALIRSIAEHATQEWPTRQFDNGFAYATMRRTYEWYAGFLGKEGFIDNLWSEDGHRHQMRTQYAAKRPEYKEVDRRMLAVAMSTLDSDPGLWVSLPRRAELLADPRVARAVKDGEAVLRAVRQNVPYDAENGFAREVIYWQV